MSERAEYIPIPSSNEGIAYTSAIDGNSYRLERTDSIWLIFQELQRAGELIRELRREVDALKAERVK